MYVNSAVINKMQVNLKPLQAFFAALSAWFFPSQLILEVQLIYFVVPRIFCRYEEVRWQKTQDKNKSRTQAYFPTAKTYKLHKATTNMNVALCMRGNCLRTDFVHLQSVGQKLEAFHTCVCNCHLSNLIVFQKRHLMKCVFSNNNL
jgi:hypothetical protein